MLEVLKFLEKGGFIITWITLYFVGYMYLHVPIYISNSIHVQQIIVFFNSYEFNCVYEATTGS